MARPLTLLELYVLAHDSYRASKVALGGAHELHNKCQLESQEAWHAVRQEVIEGRLKPGIHAVGRGRAVRLGNGDYPDIEDLFIAPSNQF